MVEAEPHVKRIVKSKTTRRDFETIERLKYTQAAVGQYDIPIEKSTIGGKIGSE